MNRIEIEILKPGAALDAFAETWQRASSGKEVTPRLVFNSIRELFSVLTEKRLELLQYVASHEALNIRQLSRQLERNYKNVHTDVAVLVEYGLLEKDEKGHLSVPFDEIVIHAGIRDAA